MNIDEYQAKLIELWGTPPDCDHLLFCAVGMAEEAGEAMGKVKRLMRGEGFDREGYLLELGDVLAYLTMAAHEKGWTLTDIFYARMTPEGGDLIRCAHQLIRKTERILDEVLCGKTEDCLLSAMMHLFMQLHWNASHHTVSSNIEEVMQLNITKLTERKSRNVLRGLGDKR
jgi:NTP pyrophosphatase (non-canonical NTP hydrolase)